MKEIFLYLWIILIVILVSSCSFSRFVSEPSFEVQVFEHIENREILSLDWPEEPDWIYLDEGFILIEEKDNTEIRYVALDYQGMKCITDLETQFIEARKINFLFQKTINSQIEQINLMSDYILSVGHSTKNYQELYILTENKYRKNNLKHILIETGISSLFILILLIL